MPADQTLPAKALPEIAAETPFYIPATGTPTRPRHTLKHGDTFVVVDSHGDIGASPGGPYVLFNCDTRYLSHFELLINGLSGWRKHDISREQNKDPRNVAHQS